MTVPLISPLTRRDWLTRTTSTAVLVARSAFPATRIRPGGTPGHGVVDPATAARVAAHAARVDPGPLQALAQRAVDAARTAGARYADVRLTRTVGHVYQWHSGRRMFSYETEVQGMGVRALINGYWGFAAACSWDAEAIVRLARDAVAQAKINAQVSAKASGSGKMRMVELAPVPVATGTWATPVSIDPFTIPVEEKLDHILSWEELASQVGVHFPDPLQSSLTFVRQERIVATSDGTLVAQTLYETGGAVVAQKDFRVTEQAPPLQTLQGLVPAGRGWEMILDANIPEQLEVVTDRTAEQQARSVQKNSVGRYTLVCDGATMAALLASTLGVATQLDRALGYEANAGGTGYLDDPLSMVGEDHLASSLVTVTANRSTPTQLATVQWDDEGVVPAPFPLVKDGVLVDFQTTREQAAWLAPYYERHGHPVRSNGCAASEDALVTPLQMMPNLVLAPGPAAIRVEDLVANVLKGVFIMNGHVQTDFQARTGLLWPGSMREIRNGQLGRWVIGGAVLFDTVDLWKKVEAIGGPATTDVIASHSDAFIYGGHGEAKGEPAQATGYSVQAVAATITNQPIIDPVRRS